MVLALGLMSGAAATTDLTVMSYNILNGGAWKDGEHAWSNRKNMVVNAIKQCPPDILGVQECFDYQAEFLAASLPDYHWFGIGREADGGGEMTAVFYRKDLLSPVETGHFWLSDTPDVPGSRSWGTHCTRMVTWARFRNRETGTVSYFLNTHFDHGSEEARLGAARLLTERIEELPEGLPVIVAGDFNATGGHSTPWQKFVDSGFSDAWRVAAHRVGPAVTFCNFTPPPQGEQSRIDWILCRGDVKVALCETVTYQEDGHYPSDHLPVLAKVRL